MSAGTAGEILDVKPKLVYKEENGWAIEKLKPHLMFDTYMGLANEQYVFETAHWDKYEKPIVTPDGTVLKHWEDVMAAKVNGKNGIDVVIVEGLEEDDLIRYVNFCVLFKKLTYLQRYILCCELEKYLRTTVKGKAWSSLLTRGKPEMDINWQLGEITGYHRESIKIYKRIGSKGIEHFDEGKTLEQMYFDADLVPAKKSMKANVSPASPVDFGTLKVDIGNYSLDFYEWKPGNKQNTVCSTTKQGKATVTITVTNPEELF